MTEPKFMTPAHRRAYLTHLNRCKVMDNYHRALIYTLTAVPALRNNINVCFDFAKDEIKPESLAAGWQTSGTTKLTRFAYNLWKECEVMIALYIDRLSVTATAAKLRVDASTVRRRRDSACDKIRKAMEEK